MQQITMTFLLCSVGHWLPVKCPEFLGWKGLEMGKGLLFICVLRLSAKGQQCKVPPTAPPCDLEEPHKEERKQFRLPGSFSLWHLCWEPGAQLVPVMVVVWAVKLDWDPTHFIVSTTEQLSDGNNIFSHDQPVLDYSLFCGAHRSSVWGSDPQMYLAIQLR